MSFESAAILSPVLGKRLGCTRLGQPVPSARRKWALGLATGILEKKTLLDLDMDCMQSTECELVWKY